MLGARPGREVVAALGDQLERQVRAEAVDLGQVLAEQRMQRRADIEGQRVRLLGSAPTLAAATDRPPAATDAQSLQHRFDPLVAGRRLVLVDIVQFQCLLQREDVLGAVVAGQRLLDCLSTGVAALVAQARQHVGVTLAGDDCADDAQAGHARDVRDDVMELQVHLCQRLLHVLDMGGRILEQPLALTQVCSQLGDLALGPEAGTQQTVFMQALQPLRVADVGLAARTCLASRALTSTTSKPRASRISKIGIQ